MKVNSSQKITWKKKKKDLSNITKARGINQYIDTIFYSSYIIGVPEYNAGIGGYALDYEHWPWGEPDSIEAAYRGLTLDYEHSWPRICLHLSDTLAHVNFNTGKLWFIVLNFTWQSVSL